MEPAWDDASLRAWFEARAGQDVLETELLKHFFPEEELGPVGLDLFHKHFALYRRLWLFDDAARTSTGHRLWIRGIRCTWLAPPLAGTCGHLDQETGVLCPQPAGLCPHRRSEQLEVNSMKSYYLDGKNAEGMTEEGLADLLQNFGRWLEDPVKTARAFEILGLPTDAKSDELKAAWRRLSLEHHPDRGGDPEAYRRITEAWATVRHRA